MRQHDSGEKTKKKRKAKTKEKSKKKNKKKKKKSVWRHASPWASWDRTLLLVCFSACFDMHTSHVYASVRVYVRV